MGGRRLGVGISYSIGLPINMRHNRLYADAGASSSTGLPISVLRSLIAHLSVGSSSSVGGGILVKRDLIAHLAVGTATSTGVDIDISQAIKMLSSDGADTLTSDAYNIILAA
jgi:hypothetical protein